MYKKILCLRGVHIGENVLFRQPKYNEFDVTRPTIITIGNNVDINKGFTVLTHDFGTFVFRNLFHDFVNSCGAVNIGNNVVIGQNVTILKGCTIGDNCIIGLGSIITKSIPSNSVAVGIPAKVVSSIEDYYKKRKLESVKEAIYYGAELYRIKKEKLCITDFSEEWCHFLTRDEYDKYDGLRKNVDWRVKGFVSDFIGKNRLYHGFEEFLQAVKEDELLKKRN